MRNRAVIQAKFQTSTARARAAARAWSSDPMPWPFMAMPNLATKNFGPASGKASRGVLVEPSAECVKGQSGGGEQDRREKTKRVLLF